KNGWVDLLMKNVDTIERYYGDFLVNTGSPHYIKTVTDIANYEVFKEGRAIRFSKDFEKEGINVNFVEVTDADTITVRTYERGVENETLSCGTGVTAAALVFAHNEAGFNRIEVNTLGGKLAVEFDKLGETFTNIWLCGPATFVFKGEIPLQF
ncbi:MAG: diaminopimelate epimerase, partial [Hydrotalea flava]|nr:diaminopimelate epimerase [Hydrotalea flava]